MGIKDGKYDERGEPIVDSTPMAMPLGVRRPPTLQEQIRRFTALELQRIRSAGDESVEDEHDLEVDDDFDAAFPPTHHELVMDESLGREVTRAEHRSLEAARREFDLRWLAARKRAAAKPKAPSVKAEAAAPKEKTSENEDLD